MGTRFAVFGVALAVGLWLNGSANGQAGIDWGNDTSEWANDGECDDPRFTGPEMSGVLLDEDRFRDASDCRRLYREGRIQLIEAVATGKNRKRKTRSIDYGDDSSEWANDGECDDPRFTGPDMHNVLLDEDRFRDASDCRRLHREGRIRLIETAAPGKAPSRRNGSIDFGDNSSEWANDGACDDPRFAGPGVFPPLLDEDRFRDANDCRQLFQDGRIHLK